MTEPNWPTEADMNDLADDLLGIVLPEGSGARLITRALELWGRPAIGPEERWYPSFADWLEGEMPEGTVIGDPLWWASKIATYLQRFGRPAIKPVLQKTIDEPQSPHPFIVKHYLSDERPTIKGNGFDGLEVGEDREEAEHFIAWVNALLVELKKCRPAIEPVPVGERLPEPGVKVLAHYFNSHGKSRTVCARWIPAKFESRDPETDDLLEYDEDSDTFYWPEGWYEEIENWDDYQCVTINEGEVTHWQPLPLWALPVPSSPTNE